MEKKKKIILIVVGVIILLLALVLILGNSKKYNVTITSDNNVLETSRVKKGTLIKDLKIPVVDGKEFLYWEVDGKKVDGNYKITKDVKINAVFKDSNECKITYELNASTVIDDTIKCGEKLEIPTSVLQQLTDSKLLYWEVDGKEFDITEPITKDTVLKAVWDTKQYTVTFDSQGGSKIASQTVNENDKAKQPVNPTREGYTFVEWQLNNKKYDFNSEVTGDITLKAVWNQNNNAVAPSTNTNSGTANNTNTNTNTNTTPATPPAVQKYTVSFNSNGGSSVASQTIESGRTASKPSNPTKSGYTFVEWQLNGRAYNFSSAVTGNITLTAVWRENQKTYTIRVSKIDDYSPDRILKVYENGTQISVKSIRYTDGTVLCSGSNTTVNVNDITGETSFKVELNNGQIVTASVS